MFTVQTTTGTLVFTSIYLSGQDSHQCVDLGFKANLKVVVDQVTEGKTHMTCRWGLCQNPLEINVIIAFLLT